MSLTLVTFLLIMAFSVLLAFLSKRGFIARNVNDILVASRGFGTLLIFFVTVGEIYGIGTMIGVPGAVYSKGSSYVIWFVGYILLAYCVGYFLNPHIWRVGKISNSSTMADFFQWRFESRGLGFLVAALSVLFLLPWAQIQFAGLSIIISYLGVEINHTAAVIVASLVAFSYVGMSGIKGSAYVAILKDILMLAAIVIGGIVAIMHMPGGVEGIYREAYAKYPTFLIVDMVPVEKNVTFLISTLLFQSLGFFMFPFIFQYLFAASSEKVLRRNMIIMPWYMLMYVFLITAAFFCLVTVPGLKNPDDAFMSMIVRNVPDWLVGVCAAGGALTCILVLADIALAVGGILSRNIISLAMPNASPSAAVLWVRLSMVIFLAVSVVITLYFPTLLIKINNIAYYCITQFLPCVLSVIFWRRVTKWGIMAGLVSGVVSVALLAFNVVNIVPYNLNKGMFALFVNIIVLVCVSLLTTPDRVTRERFALLEEK